MAQKDSKTNIELAKSSAAIAKASKEDGAVMRQIALETKKDSSAMKTIAMLTMFFLPGTFVAVSRVAFDARFPTPHLSPALLLNASNPTDRPYHHFSRNRYIR